MKTLHLVFNFLAFILAESSLIKKGLVSLKLFLNSDSGSQGFQITNILCFFFFHCYFLFLVAFQPQICLDFLNKS